MADGRDKPDHDEWRERDVDLTFESQLNDFIFTELTDTGPAGVFRLAL